MRRLKRLKIQALKSSPNINYRRLFIRWLVMKAEYSRVCWLSKIDYEDETSLYEQIQSFPNNPAVLLPSLFSWAGSANGVTYWGKLNFEFINFSNNYKKLREEQFRCRWVYKLDSFKYKAREKFWAKFFCINYDESHKRYVV